MEWIKRLFYFKKLLNAVGTPDIKIITGVRRSGKSVLLLQLKEYFEKDPNNNIVHLNFNLEKYDHLLERKAFSQYVRSQWVEGKNNILMVDEIQNVKNFERTINSLHDEGIFDIYLTGSNAFLLSSDLATLFTGRTFTINVYPFSFKEYCEYFKISNYQLEFDQYFKIGGFSGSYRHKEIDSKYDYLISDVLNPVIERDIVQKYKIRSTEELNAILNFLSDNISNLTNANSIEKTFKSQKSTLNRKTIKKYLSYFTKSFLFYECKRFDIRGKKYLAASTKFYLVDLSLRYAILGNKNLDIGRCLENLVYIELKRRGYQVYVGKLYKKEVDFVALKVNETKYIQVCYSLVNQETLQRELAPLLAIKDLYPKVIIARTGMPPYDINGIRVIDIADWLMDENLW